MQQFSNHGKKRPDRRWASPDQAGKGKWVERRKRPIQDGEKVVQRGRHGRNMMAKEWNPDGSKHPIESEMTVRASQRINARELLKSIMNLGPGADVWTRVKSMLISELPKLTAPSICNGFDDIQIEWVRGLKAGSERMVERIRWYEHG